ncbi:MAG TPA: urea carboxylase-associated family protein [Stellaceae bacterium]|nr:urea carboxylase-associated family protein [Stellaceae bacterium]
MAERRPQDPTPEEIALFERVANETSRRQRVLDHYIPAMGGFAFPVKHRQVVRILCCDGPQVADFNAFGADDASEYFWSGRTRTLHGSHVHLYDRLWGTEPRMRPMFTLIKDTVEHKKLPFNARSHDLLYSRCSERRVELRTGLKGQPNCDTNLRRALQAIGFDDRYVHDAFNVFMCTGYDDDHRLFYLEPDAKTGDHVELFAEIDAVVAISACPSGCSGDRNKGLAIEVFDQPF